VQHFADGGVPAAALQEADLDGDGRVSFADFLGVLAGSEAHIL
jgi:hypothetical protein